MSLFHFALLSSALPYFSFCSVMITVMYSLGAQGRRLGLYHHRRHLPAMRLLHLLAVRRPRLPPAQPEQPEQPEVSWDLGHHQQPSSVL